MQQTETPEQEAARKEFERNMADPMWRISNLYSILIKGDDGEDDLVMKFKPNRAQRRFISRLWHRNVILKARQLGFTTLICIAWLDYAIFTPNVRCAIIAQDREAAAFLFRDKVKFAYNSLPAEIQAAVPIVTNNATEILFGNNSSIRVASSMRGGTPHRLHVSEFGKICATAPKKAAEVMTGSITAVPKNGIVVIESTAEGQEGEFYDITKRAQALHDQKRELTLRDYRFHFFPWWQEPGYSLDPTGIIIERADEEYFAKVEQEAKTTLSAGQRAWYVSTRDTDFATNPERMWQEYPSTPDEAFKKSLAGCYYVNEMAFLRKAGRITQVPWEKGYPVNTFWDLGLNDYTAIWFHQRIGVQDRFIWYYENGNESYDHYVAEMNKRGYIWGRHYLPHDGDTKRMGMETNWTPKQMLEQLGLRNIEIVPRIDRVMTGIQMTRAAMQSAWIDEVGCATGVKRLDSYRKEWDAKRGVWKDEALHDINSNGADAFRQFGQMRAELLTNTALVEAAARAAGHSTPRKSRGAARGSWRTS